MRAPEQARPAPTQERGGPPKPQHVGDNASAPRRPTEELRGEIQEPVALYVRVLDALYVQWFRVSR